jgi:hypothetical protein
MKYNAAQTCESSYGEVEDYIQYYGDYKTTAKTGIDLGNEKSISDV